MTFIWAGYLCDITSGIPRWSCVCLFVCVCVCVCDITLQDQTDNISECSSFPRSGAEKERAKYQQLNIIHLQLKFFPWHKWSLWHIVRAFSPVFIYLAVFHPHTRFFSHCLLFFLSLALISVPTYCHFLHRLPLLFRCCCWGLLSHSFYCLSVSNLTLSIFLNSIETTYHTWLYPTQFLLRLRRPLWCTLLFYFFF